MILSILLAVVFFYTGMFLSLAGFLFPVHMIRVMVQKNKKESAIVHLIVYLILLLATLSMGEDKILMMIFIGVYAIIELIYFVFKKLNWLGTFDKMFITSLVALAFILLVYFLNIELFKGYLEIIKVFNKEQLQLPDDFLVVYNKTILEQSIYILFTYLFIITGVIYMYFDRKNILKWEMSYLYLIPYITAVVMQDIFKIDNVYLNNLVLSLRFVYIAYGVKVAFIYLRKKVRYNVLTTIIVVVITRAFPIATFVVGAIRSFDLKLSLGKASSN